MTKISITLPSIRPNALKCILSELFWTKSKSDDISLEIVICRSDDDSRYNHNYGWLKFVVDRYMTGAPMGHQQAFDHVTGDFVFAFVDDHTLIQDWDKIILEDFLHRESLTDRRPFCLGVRQKEPHEHVGTVFGNYYPYFPFMRTGDAKKIGWLSGDYKKGFADCDLGMRVLHIGGLCEWSEQSVIIPQSDNDGSGIVDDKEDMDWFLTKWGGLSYINKRQFNVDVPVIQGKRTLP